MKNKILLFLVIVMSAFSGYSQTSFPAPYNVTEISADASNVSLVCPAPTTLSVSNVTPFGATFHWFSLSVTSWNVLILPPGSPTPTMATSGWIVTDGGGGSGPIHSYTLSPILIPNTCYVFYVRSDCGASEGTSAWVGPYNFCTTPTTCPSPTNLTSTHPNVVSADLSWTEVGTANNWELIIQTYNGPVPTNASTGTTVSLTAGPTVTFNSGILAPGIYEYYVRSVCSDIDKSPWSGPYTFYIATSNSACASIDFDMETTSSGEIDICSAENCVDLSATYTDLKDTSTYSVLPLIYNPYPTTGGIEMQIISDDKWSAPFLLPFNFCFFGVNYPTLNVGSNGVITFNSFAEGDICEWNTDPGQIIPDTSFPIRNAIYGVFQDINPPVNTAPILRSINYQVIGTAPCRLFVLNYLNIGQFSCGTNIGLQTSQIVLHENSNIIDIYIKDRTACNDWNEGAGVVGLQNADGTQAHFPPNRNLGNWEAHNEAWRFTPNGASNTTFSWLKDGVFYSNNPAINMCVSETTNMTAQASYTDCAGTISTITNNVLLNFINPTAPTGASIQITGVGATVENLVATGQNIQWYSDPTGGSPLPTNTPLVNGATYYASQSLSSCESANRLAVTVEILLANDNFNSITYSYSPNPVDDVLHIKASAKLKVAKVCNLLGQTLLEQKFDSKEITLNMHMLPTGTYIVLIETENGKETFKIVKE
jgi:hypothetical protein